MRVALLRLEYGPDNYIHANEHLGIGYLASSLRERGIETRLFDNTVRTDDQIRTHLMAYRPDVIGYTTNYESMLGLLKFDHALNLTARPFKILGGAQTSFCAEVVLNNEDFDAVAIGESEETLPSLVDALKKGTELANVPGLVYRDGSGIHRTPNRSGVNDLDSLSTPARDILAVQVSDYGSKAARVSTSRGCVYTCAFCVTPVANLANPGRPLRMRSSTNVVDELEQLNRQYGISHFYFNDDLYFYRNVRSKSRAAAIAQEIIKRELKIRYKVEIRADSVSCGDSDFVRLLTSSGLDRVFVGIESGSESMLQFLNKRTRPETNKEFVDFIESFGIRVHVGRILFGPFTTWDELSDSINLYKEIRKSAQLLRRPNTKVLAFPGTALTQRMEQEGLFVDSIPYLDREYRFSDDLIGRFYAALTAAFNEIFPHVQSIFDLGVEGRDEATLEEAINGITHDFFMENVKLRDKWTEAAFEDGKERFIEKLKGAIK